MRCIWPHHRREDQLSPGKEFRSQDRWLALAAFAVVSVMVVALVLQVDSVSPTAKSALITFLALGLATAMVGIVGWAIASMRFWRTEAGRAATDEAAATAPVRNRWAYPLAIGAGLLAGIAYLSFPQGRFWLWRVFVVVNVVAMTWLWLRRRRPAENAKAPQRPHRVRGPKSDGE
jgi:hypothetical protein